MGRRAPAVATGRLLEAGQRLEALRRQAAGGGAPSAGGAGVVHAIREGRMSAAPSPRGARGGARASRTGTADLPLHGGRVPPWLFERMARLGRVLAEAIVLAYGRDELLRRLSHPFWFQALGALMGMDWHSSGITTSVVGALQRGLAPLEGELGLRVCGGRGRHSRKTPGELTAFGDRTGVDGVQLVRASRLVAKVDGAAVQDGHSLYLHAFFVAADGRWAVVQQGMDPVRRRARRYHWLSEGLESFVDEPHAAIDGQPGGAILNLTDRRARPSREAQLALLREGPDRIVEVVRRVGAVAPMRRGPDTAAAAALPRLSLPDHHDVRAGDVVLRRLHGALAAAAERGPVDFADLLLTPGLGARTVFSLALAAEVLHGTPCRFTDPARFSLAHGGKDGHPYPVPLRVYDETLAVLRRAVDRAKLGEDDRLVAIRRLDVEARRLEAAARGPSLEELIAAERGASGAYGGRTVFDGGPAASSAPPPRPSGRPTAADGAMRKATAPAPSTAIPRPSKPPTAAPTRASTPASHPGAASHPAVVRTRTQPTDAPAQLSLRLDRRR